MKTVPQYIYIPKEDGTFSLFSIVFCYDNQTEYKNFVANAPSEIVAIGLVNKLLSIT